MTKKYSLERRLIDWTFTARYTNVQMSELKHVEKQEVKNAEQFERHSPKSNIVKSPVKS